MSKVFEQIHTLTDQQLEDLYSNIIIHILKYEEAANAAQVELGKKNLGLVTKEIERRGELAAKGEYKAGKRDDEGILAVMGYRVGKHEGVQTKIRRIILDRAVNGPLPPLANLAHLHEWGAPGSEKRLSKIARMICFFLIKNMSYDDENYAKAIIEWREDMDWLKKTYYEPRNCTFKWPEIS